MSQSAIRSFWSWWASARDQVEAAIGSGSWDELAPQINARVTAIDPELSWELAKGESSEHAFCLCARGDLRLRNVAERWLREGPPRDGTWEFHASRQARWSDGLALRIDEHEVPFDLLRFRVEVDSSRERVHVGIHHPAMRNMSDELRSTVAFLALDTLFGEDGVERWIGSVETLVDAPDGAERAQTLRDAVDELTRGATGERFAVLEGVDREGNPVFMSVNLALKRIDHLLADVHVGITIALEQPTEAGLTTRAEATELDRMEDELLAALGPDTVYVGRETRRGERVIHLYVAESSGAQAGLEVWRKSYGARRIKVDVTSDPTWTRTAEIRGN